MGRGQGVSTRGLTATVTLAVLLFVGGHAAAAEDAEVTQTTPHGRINWTTKVITVTGTGAPSLKAPNIAVARLGAERSAKLDALHNIVEAVRVLQLTGTQTVGALLDAQVPVKDAVDTLCKGFRTSDTRYFADGGVDITAQLPLDGPLTEALVPGGGKAAPAGAANDTTLDSTGIIINAKGLGANAALAPRIVDDTGHEVYSVVSVSKDALRQHGPTSYTKSLELASKDSRVADKPLIIRAQKLVTAGGADLVIAAADAAKMATLKSVLTQGRVIIVVD